MQFFKVFIMMLVFITAIIATPVPVQKRQDPSDPSQGGDQSGNGGDQSGNGGDQSSPSGDSPSGGGDPCTSSGSILADNVPAKSDGGDPTPYGC
ncbi:hypothetical protein RclHR1_01320020 [Rhizophagus clarus]|uniref:Uncharacterized protein n=1 Tax=Rhizophagus clarus TaxID=94130 RepID=A0A2Z6QB92_9GLOM|nr:hypothetical protein RclHR1_01320020 [Rhizophagus clarus]